MHHTHEDIHDHDLDLNDGHKSDADSAGFQQHHHHCHHHHHHQGGRPQREGGKGQLWAVAAGQQIAINMKFDEDKVIIMTKITSFISCTRP